MEFSADDLRDAAGDVVFARGEDYVRHVRDLRVDDSRARASVRATRAYDVLLDWTGGRISGTCTCPHNAEGNFCKHLVAVGLSALGYSSDGRPDDVEIGDYLEHLDRDALRDLVLALVDRDESALRVVQTRALASGSADAIDSAELVTMVNASLRVGFVEYQRSFEVAQEAQNVLDSLQEILDSGAADAVLPALERAATRLRKIILNADDSGGVIGDACQRAVDLHAQAACAGRPDGVRLGRWLAKFRIDSPGWPDVTLDMYVDAFDEKAMSAYRAAVQQEDQAKRGIDHWHRFEIDRMLLELADHGGDLEEAIRLLSSEEHPQFGAIVARLRTAGRPADALQWIDRAVAEGRVSGFGQNGNDYWISPEDAANSYLGVGRAEDAVAVARAEFVQRQDPASLRLLLQIAGSLGTADAERAWAISAAEKAASAPFGSGSALIEIALAEGDLVAAWSAAERFGPGGSWRRLAEDSADELPVAAAELYRPEIERLLQISNTRNYPPAAKLLVIMRGLYARVDEQATFTAYIADIRARFGRRPSLMKELDRRGI
ncbi:MAG TPA: hypothetical protein VHX59_05995 [Mycobacteriales bacterium]|nr:hypothetical protein [Mycobacteriales bacterium]